MNGGARTRQRYRGITLSHICRICQDETALIAPFPEGVVGGRRQMSAVNSRPFRSSPATAISVRDTYSEVTTFATGMARGAFYPGNNRESE